MTTTNDFPTGPGGMSAEWREFALKLRDMAAELGAPLDECMPGEEQSCGHDYGHHALSYMAALQARAEYGLRHLHHGDPGGEAMGAKLLEFWREAFKRDDDCGNNHPHTLT